MLGLPSSVAWLGWIGGPVALVVFFLFSLWAALMLTEVYMVSVVFLDILSYSHGVVLPLDRQLNVYTLLRTPNLVHESSNSVEQQSLAADSC